MSGSKKKHTVRLALLGATLLLGASAQAGYVRAQADEGSYPAVVDQNPGVLATAQSPNNVPGGDATASATRLRVAAASNGAGAGPTGQYFHAANASNYSTYRLWDFDANAALDSGQARLLNLSFNFRVLSQLNVPIGGLGLAVGTTRFGATVVSADSAIINSFADSVSYAVGPPDSYTGNLALLGSYDYAFSVLHDASDDGWLEMAFGNSGANNVTAFGALTLLSIGVTEDQPVTSLRSLQASTLGANTTASVLNGRRLGVMFDSGDGYLFNTALGPVSAVPEPGTLLLALGGLAWLTVRSSSPRKVRRVS
jgi:hypothetical protein